MLTLRFLELKDEATFRDSLAEDWQGFPYAHLWEPGMAMATYLKKLEALRLGEDLQPGWVPATFLFAFVRQSDGSDRCVGRVSIRHRLLPGMEIVGGHIGYAVRPSERKKGYATAILGHSLAVAKMIGIEKAIVTCDDANLGSLRTIERNGGYLDETFPDPATGVLKRRYWIPL